VAGVSGFFSGVTTAVFIGVIVTVAEPCACAALSLGIKRMESGIDTEDVAFDIGTTTMLDVALPSVYAVPHGMAAKFCPDAIAEIWTPASHWYKNAYEPLVFVEYFHEMLAALPDAIVAGADTAIDESAFCPQKEVNQPPERDAR